MEDKRYLKPFKLVIIPFFYFSFIPSTKNIIMEQLQSRRSFVGKATVLLGSLMPLTGYSFFRSQQGIIDDHELIEQLKIDLSDLPNFCTHEHWGSIDSIGHAPEQNGYRGDTTAGALPLHDTSIWDLFLDPYEGGWLHVSQKNPNIKAKEAGYNDIRQWWLQSPAEALKAFQEVVRSSVITGGFQCTRRGIQMLYGKDLGKFALKDWKWVDEQVSKRYQQPFNWYEQAMKRAHFSELIRPVHPEFYFLKQNDESKLKEASFTHTVLRIDPFLDLWNENNKRRNQLSDIVGIDPVDARSWRLFIEKLFDVAQANGAVGIKQLQAYRRPLHFTHHDDNAVSFRGALSNEEISAFQDWIVHECSRQCQERKWVHQVHVGTNNLKSSTPLPLQYLAQSYPDMKLVMIHCWPFLQESGYLAKMFPNMYVDTCWLPVLNPEFLRDAFHYWLNYVPAHKIMLGHDSTHVEMAAGSSLFTRELLAESLVHQQKKLKMERGALRSLAADMLHNNAVRLYQLGNIYTV